MSSCPKCGQKLRFYNISQFCPKCGVNMRFVNFEENFIREAKQAELSQATVHVKIRRLKAALIGSKLCIARLCVMLLPILSMLIPAGEFTVNLPYRSEGFGFSALSAYNIISGGAMDYLNTMAGSAFTGADFKALITAFTVYLSVAVFAVLVFLTSLLCFISYKNMQKITCVISALGIVDSIVAVVFISNFASGVNNNPLLTTKSGFGLFLTAVMFAVVFAVNFILVKKGIAVEYDEGMVERVSIYRKIKSGELNIDDLSQPVVETAATRAIDEEIAKEEAAYEERMASAKNAAKTEKEGQ